MGENGQTQMKYWEAAPEGHKAKETHPSHTEDSKIQAQTHNFVTYNNLASEDADHDLENGWNQMDALTEQPYIHSCLGITIL